jgi:DNA ligase-1
VTILPTLYKIASTGARQEWTISFEGNWYAARFGQTGGAMQTTAPTMCEGKQGRTDEQQAEFEAVALWEKKLKKDYTLDPDVKAGDTSDLIEGGVLPMLAHRFDQHGDKIKYPCFVQPKLDGHRCIGMPDRGLWSRTRKRITGVPHIEDALLDKFPATGFAFDGELYNHKYHDHFEELTHFIRQSKPEEGCEIVQYHIYDLVGNPGETFRERWCTLENMWANETIMGPLVLVETREVNNEDELMLAFEDFTRQGFEGAIVRNADGLYVNKRSYDLLKIKTFLDSEFLCTGVEEGKGKMAGHAIFVCITESGTEFRAKMKGDHDALAEFVEHPELVVGKQVTVKYQGLTGKNNVPRFPVAWRIREVSV